MGKIVGQPEVHADGEIWGQTLWQIHQQLGSATSERLITEAMELSPPNPPMLDQRNAVLQADEVAFGGSHQNTLCGASVTSFTPPDYSPFGCGPEQAFDTSQTTGWGSDSPGNGGSGTTGARSVTLHLPAPVDISQLQIDPGATCGDPDSAGVQEYTVKTRAVAASGFVTAWHNRSALPEHVYSPRKPHKGNLNVDTLKLTMSSNRGNANFMDMSELLVHGVPPG
jgi:hypothetical protein